jgi:protocatechuate 3,4-dioxygenase, beta subunit
MQSPFVLTDRRRFIATLALGGAAFSVRGAFAEQLARTAAQTEGPFYPDRLPLDTDNDLIIVNNGITPAVGEITHLSGRILDDTGAGIRNAVVEIWQCDHEGVYIHSGDVSRKPRDGNFQGFGRFLTDSSGGYYFRTIKPVPYPGRTPHIHFKVKPGVRVLITTQCYIKGHPGNPKDRIWSSVTDPRERDSITIDFTPVSGSPASELAARFDIVVGRTPTA